MKLEDLKPRFFSLPPEEQILLVTKIQTSRLTPKTPKSPGQKRIQDRVRTKSKREKEIAKLQSMYDLLQELNSKEK